MASSVGEKTTPDASVVPSPPDGTEMVFMHRIGGGGYKLFVAMLFLR